MKYTIISTYPELGSKNIGDALIEKSTVEAIRQIKGDNSEFEVIWRQENWDTVKNKLLSSDAVIFACLAIRKNMFSTYTYINELIDSNIPIGIISAGTALNMNSNLDNLFDFPSEDLTILKQLNDQSIFFTSRGYLSQRFCTANNLDKVVFSGDISFLDERFKNIKFENNFRIKRIAISDPHYGKSFLKSLNLLIENLKIIFPNSKIDVLLHGVNKDIEDFCQTNKIGCNKIYLDKKNGLDAYNLYDLHVGYRIHGHVSALLRRIPSYLLEQDGRGCDYGLTIDRKISVSSFYKPETNKLKTLLNKLFHLNLKTSKTVPLHPVHQLISIISEDAKTGFKKFINLENQLLSFNDKVIKAITKLP